MCFCSGSVSAYTILSVLRYVRRSFFLVLWWEMYEDKERSILFIALLGNNTFERSTWRGDFDVWVGYWLLVRQDVLSWTRCGSVSKSDGRTWRELEDVHARRIYGPVIVKFYRRTMSVNLVVRWRALDFTASDRSQRTCQMYRKHQIFQRVVRVVILISSNRTRCSLTMR